MKLELVFAIAIVAIQLVLPTTACSSRSSQPLEGKKREEGLVFFSLRKNRLVRENIDLTEESMGPAAKYGDSCDPEEYQKRFKEIYWHDHRLGYKLSIYERSDSLYEQIQKVRKEYQDSKLNPSGAGGDTRKQLCMGFSLMYCNNKSRTCKCLNGEPFDNYKMVPEKYGDETFCVAEDDTKCNPQSLLFCKRNSVCMREWDYLRGTMLPSCSCVAGTPEMETDISQSNPELFTVPQNNYGVDVAWFARIDMCTNTSADYPYRYRPRSYQ